MSTGFSREQSQAILDRDGTCAMYGSGPQCRGRAEVANHRAGRGMGGSKLANTLPNGCGLCHVCNGEIEADARLAEVARRRGVKLLRTDDPEGVPVWSSRYQQFVVLTRWGMFLTGEKNVHLDVRELVVVPTGFELRPNNPGSEALGGSR